MNQDTPKNLREELIALGQAIKDSPCPFCGAAAGKPCLTKPKTPFRAPFPTQVHHIGRVHAGHARRHKQNAK